MKFFESVGETGQSAVKKVNAPKVYKQSRQALSVAFAAAAGIGGALIDFLKLDIVRDFAQNVALFFANIASKALELAKNTFGRLFGLIAVDLNMVAESINPMFIMGILGVLALVFFVLFLVLFFMSKKMNPDEIRQGHEVIKWDERKEEEKKKVMFIQYGLLAGTSLYLPISRSLAEIIRCGPRMIRVLVEDRFLEVKEVIESPDAGNCTGLKTLLDDGVNDFEIINEDRGADFSDCDCTDWEHYGTLRFISVVLVLMFTIGFPAYCVWLIKQNKPYGSREDPDKCYDEEGHLVEYTDDRYQDDLKNDPNQRNCPYISLYDGYERQWSFYKIWVMGTKFLLVLPTIIWYQSPTGQSVISAVILGVLGGFSFYSTPFLDNTDDVLDASGRVASMLTVLFSLFGSLGASDAFGALVMLANAVNIAIMGIVTLWSFAKVRAIVKSISGQLQFSDSVKKTVGSAKHIISHWDFSAEIKRRVWHPFWEAVLLEEGEVYAKRLTDMQNKARDTGKHRILEHWKNGANPEIEEVRERLIEDHEGVDVYYRKPEEEENNEKTFFGKMYIIAYPFHAVVVYDNPDDYEKDKDYEFIWEDRTQELLDQNEDEEIRRRKLVRQKLRGLCDDDLGYGPELTYHLQRWETHEVPDGTRTYRDNDGKERTEQLYSTVQVLMTYSKGKLSIGMNYDLPMQAGFNFQLNLTDGEGEVTAPRTGEHRTVRNRTTLSMKDAGIDSTFDENCDALKQLLGNSPNDKIWPRGLEAWQKKKQEYRENLMKRRCKEEAILSSAFWLHIYDNDTATREEIDSYFHNFEARDRVKKIPERHKDGLDYVMNIMDWVNKHPCAAIWYIFFHDLWDTNNEVGKISKQQEAFDPSEETSIAFMPMKRNKLEEWLGDKGMKGKFRWVTPGILDLLYDLIDKTDEEFEKFDEEMQAIDKEDEGEDEKEEDRREKASKANNQYTRAVQCAYQIRRNTTTNQVISQSLCQMKEGKVRNIATYGNFAYIPAEIEGEKASNPLRDNDKGIKEDSDGE